MIPEILYEEKFQPWDRSWLLSGPVGATGKLNFQPAKYAASHARWAAMIDGGTIKVYDAEGQLFKTIEIETDEFGEDGLILPSC